MDRKPLRQFATLPNIYVTTGTRGTSKSHLLLTLTNIMWRCGGAGSNQKRKSDNSGWLEGEKCSFHRNVRTSKPCMVVKSAGAWYAKRSLSFPMSSYYDCCTQEKRTDYHANIDNKSEINVIQISPPTASPFRATQIKNRNGIMDRIELPYSIWFRIFRYISRLT